MKIRAIVKALSEKSEGISRATGNQWRNQRLILEWDEGEPGSTFTQRVAATAFNALVDQISQSGLHPGQTVEADLHFQTRPFRQSDYVTTDVTLNALILC